MASARLSEKDPMRDRPNLQFDKEGVGVSAVRARKTLAFSSNKSHFQGQDASVTNRATWPWIFQRNSARMAGDIRVAKHPYFGTTSVPEAAHTAPKSMVVFVVSGQV
jgi:hypothetical protein